MPLILRKARLELRRPLKINSCETADPNFTQQLDSLVDKAKSKKNMDTEIVQSIESCIEKMKEIHSYCHEYDYSDIPANGYRTMLLCARNILDRGINKWNHRKTKRCEQFKHILQNLLATAPLIDYIRSASSSDTVIDDLDLYKKMTMKYFTSGFKNCLPLYDQFNGSLYTLRLGKLICSFRNLAISFMSGNKLTFFFHLLNDSRYFSRVDRYSRNVDINILKITDKMLSKPLTRGLLRKVRHSTIKVVNIASQNQYQVRVIHSSRDNGKSHSSDARIIQLNTQSTQISRHHRCLVIKNQAKDATYSKCLLIHIHGGAFVFGSPELHLLYNSKWADDFPGGTVLVPEFGLAPEHKFPSDIQVLFDIYFWLTRSSAADQVELLGTTVDKIIILGDSSGALQTLSLTLVLNDLRHNRNIYDELGNVISNAAVKLPMPAGLFLIYPVIAINQVIAPSHLLMPFHFLVLPHVVISTTLSYVPNRLCDSSLLSFVEKLTLPEDEKKRLIKLIEKQLNENKSPEEFNYLRYYKKNNFHPHVTQDTTEQLFMSANLDILKHPYVSPLNYGHLDELKDVGIVIHAVRSDLWIDGVVELMKKWPGYSSLHVMDDLFHSYLPLYPFGGIMKEACDLVITHVKERFDATNTIHHDSSSSSQ